MPIRFVKQTAYLEEVCTVEDAEPLLDWLQRHRKGSVNLKQCSHLHAAVLQVLMATAPKISAPPPEGFLREHVLPALQR